MDLALQLHDADVDRVTCPAVRADILEPLWGPVDAAEWDYLPI